jgi:hypothetical protein
MLLAMKDKRKAAGFAGLAVGYLCFSLIVGGLVPGASAGAAILGYVGFVVWSGRAMTLWRVEERSPLLGPSPERGSRPKAVGLAASLGLLLLVVPVLAQQTIFNVPTADVLDRGKTYVEVDALWRPQEPDFTVFTGRGVYGFGSSIEGGVNFGGFVTPGRSVPTATPNIKWQPWKNEAFAVTTGLYGLFFLRGSKDGDPAALGYAHVAAKLPTNTRVTVGGYWGSSGYAAPDPQAGALVGFEQVVLPHLNLIADWFSGENGLGYFTPGISSTWGGWTLYAGYSIKNGDSNGNAMLLELGFTF